MLKIAFKKITEDANIVLVDYMMKETVLKFVINVEELAILQMYTFS